MTRKNIYMFFVHAISVLFFLAHVPASGHGAATADSAPPGDTARISSIRAAVKDLSVNVVIEADRPLAYTSVKQPFPLAVILYLEGASIDAADIAQVVENDVVSSVGVSESVVSNVVSRVEILLKKEVPFNVESDGATLTAVFEKSAPGEPVENGAVAGGDSRKASFARAPAEKPLSDAGLKPVRRAKTLENVEVSVMDEFVEINIAGDGQITDFETFTVEETIENPARIVFDMFNVNTAEEIEKQIALGSKWADKVRYRGYKDRVRLVIDTKNKYLASYFGVPSENGLKITVGENSGSAPKNDAPVPAAAVAAITEKSAPPEVEDREPEKRKEPVEQAPLVPKDDSAESVAVGLNETREASVDVSPTAPEKEIDEVAPALSVNAISSVSTMTSGDRLVVIVGAKKRIEDFNYLTIEHSEKGPARIVVDMFGLQSPFEDEQMVPVNFDRVHRVRHMGHSDKVRLVIDTSDEMLSAFTVQPSENGLEIEVGPPAQAKELPAPATAVAGDFQPAASPLPPAPEPEVPLADAVAEEDRLAAEKTSAEPLILAAGDLSSESDAPAAKAEPIVTKPAESSLPPEPEVPLAAAVVAEDRLAAEKTSAEPLILAAGDLSSESDAPAAKAEPTVTKPATFSGPNWVNRIEFSSQPAGKSTIVVGAAHPIEYEVKEDPGNKKIIVRLFNTKIAAAQKRPLITTRFESAVDRVLPVYTSSMKDSVISIELREMTRYDVSAFDNTLNISFDASSIPPKPFEESGLPSWRQAMSGPALDFEGRPSAGSAAGSAAGVAPEFEPASVGTAEPGLSYTGEKIALDFFETDIKNVFRILREVSGKNFAIDKDVSGSVTLTLEKPVPWDQVLDLILKMNQLGKVEEGDIIRIAKMATITKEERDRQAKIAAEAQAREQEKAVEPLLTEYIPINYSDAKTEILPHLQNIATKERGSLSVDSRTNTVIMTDTAEKIRQAREIVQRLDKVTPQVIIEARVVEASSTFSREIGVEWTTDGGIPNDDERAGIGPQRAYDALGGTWAYDAAVNLPVNSAGSIGFQFKRIFGTPLTIDARLMAMESNGEGKIVSAPKVLTLDNKKATIKQGREVPYSVVDEDGRANVQFKDVDLLLEVTPHVTPDNRISLRVFITKNEIAEFSVDGVPSLSTKEAETELLVNDGETIVIGGILQTTDQETTEEVPVLGSIPVLKWLFRSDVKSSRKEELLIFLTPRIMQLEQRNI